MLDKDDLYKVITFIKNWKSVGDDVEYAIITYEDFCYLVFKQTDSKRDWINNFNFPVKPYKNQESCLLVARGWGNAYKSCNDEIMNDFISQLNGKVPVICGWSYGGAMSVIASEDFYYRTKIKPIVITYGAPKPLFGTRSKRYVNSCTQYTRQYSHKSDVVTLLPPFLGYKRLCSNWIGKFNLFGLFNPEKYHCIYGTKSLYDNL